MNLKIQIDKLERLYKRIPEFECEYNCGECCGPVGFAAAEWQRLPEKREFSDFKTLNCPYLDKDNQCSIYPLRPFICRLFGATDGLMRCPKGRGPKARLGRIETNRLSERYKKIMSYNPDKSHILAPKHIVDLLCHIGSSGKIISLAKNQKRLMVDFMNQSHEGPDEKSQTDSDS